MSSPGPEPGGAWARVGDDLLAGLHHALNNRVAALGAAVQVLQVDLAPEHPLREVLGRELERMRATVELLGLLPHGRRGPEPVQLPHALAPLAELYACHTGLRDIPLRVEGDPGVMPLWIEPSALARALLVLLSAAGHAAQGRAGAEIRLRYGGDQCTVTVEVEPAGGPRREPAGDERLPEIDPRSVQPLLAEHGAALHVRREASGLPLYVVELPSLLEARRQGR